MVAVDAVVSACLSICDQVALYLLSEFESTLLMNKMSLYASNSNKSINLDSIGLPDEVADWDLNHVSQFIRSNLHLSKSLQDSDIEKMVKGKVDGLNLLALNEDKIRKMGVEGLGAVEGVMRIVEGLKETIQVRVKGGTGE
jgi:hypothetical protein